MAIEKDFNIQEYEALCPGVNRRSLQRDLADLIEKDIITQDGIKKAARYRLNCSDDFLRHFMTCFYDENASFMSQRNCVLVTLERRGLM